MNLAVTLEHRFDRTPDGAVWTEIMFAHPFWRPYLEVFDQVRVIARVREVPKAEPGWKRADGDRVSFCVLPHFIGPSQYIATAWRLRRAVQNAVGASDAVILRAPGIVSFVTYGRLLADKRTFGVEVVADPYDAFAPGAVRHPLRPFFRWWFYRQLRRQCGSADAIAYVTEEVLQARYPAREDAYTSHYSDVELPDAAFVSAPRPARTSPGPITLITVASFNMLYKGQDVLIDAAALCVQRGLDLHLILVGDGRLRPEIEARARKRRLGNRVRFLGQLPAGDVVRAQLDQTDLFVLPSRTEGLPRALIEAMARGLPCVGTAVGGITELLPPEDTAPPGDAVALSQKIQEVATNPERMARMSDRNLTKVQEYREEALRERRNAFYLCLAERTAAERTAAQRKA